MHTAQAVISALEAIRAPEEDPSRFFFDGIGDTQTLGVGIGKVFPVAKAHRRMALSELDALLDSRFYEVRMAAAAIMDFQARDGKGPVWRDELYALYLRRHDRLNNWDFVDRAAPSVVGRYLADKPRDPLYALAKSSDPWRRRTALVATYAFIRAGDASDTFKIGDLLADDAHVMVQKALGSWIRTAGQSDPQAMDAFLERNLSRLPAPTLTMILEKTSPAIRQRWRDRKQGLK